MQIRTVALTLTLALLALPALADDSAAPLQPPPEPVTAADVVNVFERLPAECSLYKGLGSCPKGTPGRFRSKEIPAYAAAIAVEARDLTEAATAATFLAYESAVNSHAVGDKDSKDGASYGGFQMKEFWIAKEKATDPASAVHAWLLLKRRSEELCSGNPPDARLAALASGNCSHAWRRVERRMQVVRDVVAAVRTAKEAARAAKDARVVTAEPRYVGIE